MKHLLLTIIFAFLSISALGKTISIERGDYNEVWFSATASPGFLEFDGKGGWVEGTATVERGKLSGIFTSPMDVFKTGLSLRDEHMREKYMHVDKYPKATFELNPTALRSGPANLKGKLTLHGVTKDVVAKGEMKKTADGWRISAKLDLVLSDYNIDIPSWLGVTVAETVEAHIKMAF